MSNFGALTDHFGLASASLVLVDSNESLVEQSRADANDENNDIAATSYYGNTTQDLREVSCIYALRSATLNINTIKLGALAATPTVLRESIEVSTSNDGWPQITVTGKKNISAITAPSGKLNTFTIPSVTLSGMKQAQLICFTVGTGCRLTGSSLSASVDMAQQDDGLGEPVAFGVSGGQGTISAEFVRITAAPTFTLNTTGNTTLGLTVTANPGVEQGQSAYHTGTGTIGFTITRDNA
jgi:hypothetical protein